MDSNIIDNLSIVQQEYIETIHSICKGHDHAHTKQIATVMNVSMPSVVDALLALSRFKLINYKTRHPVTLTPLGKEIAKVLSSRQKALSDFFSNILGFDKEYSEKVACDIEHVLDEKLKNRISAFNAFFKNESSKSNTLKRFKEENESI